MKNVEVPTMLSHITRRAFLRATVAAGMAASSHATIPVGVAKKKVVVVGAGLAGLAAAWELS